MPQFALSVRRSRSQPFAVLPSQLPKPPLQVMPQVDAAQVAVAFARAGQAFPQAPQCAGLDVVFTQAPLHSVGVPAEQEAAHAPPEHTCPAGHGFTQRPQLPTEMRRSVSQPLASLPSQLPKFAEQV